ncbi:MAG: hypothetical protein EPO68_17320 [Planctomycetota bacterium]|nr:MAG: hypothetical protein EPO68_17320 [Planctomycetota bacterium]
MHVRLPLLSSLLALFIWIPCACAAGPEPIAPRPVTLARPGADAPKPADFDGLHNVVAYSDGLYSGSAPEGHGLESLADMGIRTVVSVDGAQPDVDAARALGLRYVHLPIGYDGMDETRKLELARVVRDLPGPIYVHCHHGKHRSAGAAAAIAVMLGRLSNEQALARMKVSGTAPNYTGLYACATETSLATAAQIDAASNQFPSRWKTTGLVQGMVDIDFALDNMKAVEKASWKAPAEHPDLVPAAEVGRIAHVSRELEDDAEVKAKPAEFLQMLRASTAAAEAFEKALLESASADVLAGHMKKLGQSCKDCHVKYRDAH